MSTTTMKIIFAKKMKELNVKRAKKGLHLLTKAEIAQVIFSDNNSSANSKAQQLSNVLSGKAEFKAIHFRIIRKLFGCTIDEFFPITEDFDLVVEI